MTPFKHVPKSQFFFRMLAPAGVVFYLGLYGLGVLSADPQFQGKPLPQIFTPSSRAPSGILPPVEMARHHIETLVDEMTHVPEVCWSGNMVNDFQTKQCNQFWERQYLKGGLATIPFAAVLLFFFITMDMLAGTYRKARKKVDGGQASFPGTVTSPAIAPNDFFGFFYCCRAISVELKNKKQIKVYMPLDAPVPLPGQTLAVFEMGKIFGEKRHVAVLYAPHLAVVAGVHR